MESENGVFDEVEKFVDELEALGAAKMAAYDRLDTCDDVVSRCAPEELPDSLAARDVARRALEIARRSQCERDPKIGAIAERFQIARKSFHEERVQQFLRDETAAIAAARSLLQRRDALILRLGIEEDRLLSDATLLGNHGSGAVEARNDPGIDRPRELSERLAALQEQAAVRATEPGLAERFQAEWRPHEFDQYGLFRVSKEETWDNRTFRAGDLIDRYRVPVGVLNRFFMARSIRPTANGEGVAA